MTTRDPHLDAIEQQRKITILTTKRARNGKNANEGNSIRGQAERYARLTNETSRTTPGKSTFRLFTTDGKFHNAVHHTRTLMNSFHRRHRRGERAASSVAVTLLASGQSVRPENGPRFFPFSAKCPQTGVFRCFCAVPRGIISQWRERERMYEVHSYAQSNPRRRRFERWLEKFGARGDFECHCLRIR